MNKNNISAKKGGTYLEFLILVLSDLEKLNISSVKIWAGDDRMFMLKIKDATFSHQLNKHSEVDIICDNGIEEDCFSDYFVTHNTFFSVPLDLISWLIHIWGGVTAYQYNGKEYQNLSI